MRRTIAQSPLAVHAWSESSYAATSALLGGSCGVGLYPVAGHPVHDVLLHVAQRVVNALHALQAAVGAIHVGCGLRRVLARLRAHVVKHGLQQLSVLVAQSSLWCNCWLEVEEHWPHNAAQSKEGQRQVLVWTRDHIFV